MSEPGYLLAAYGEICKKHNALDEFRMKLLGLLPIASVVGLFALDRSKGISAAGPVPDEVVTYLGGFAALFTVALFLYEVRGILMCHDLTKKGIELENTMNVSGQFQVCGEQRKCNESKARNFFLTHLNAKFAASFVYSLVVAAWLFVALRFGLHNDFPMCVLLAGGTGLLLALCSYRCIIWLLRDTPQPGDLASRSAGPPQPLEAAPRP